MRRPRTGVALGAALAMVLATTPRLRAAPRASAQARKIIVVDLSADEKEHAELLHELRVAVAKHTNTDGLRDYELKDLDAILNAGGEVQDRQNIATARGLLDTGRAALEEGAAEDAVDNFVSAVQLYEQSFGVMPDPSVYGEALLLLGVAQLQAGNAEGAERAFRKAVIARADASALTGDAKAAYDAAAAAVDAMPLGAVQVNTEPPYAEVYVDGRYKGISPKTVAGLPEGPHVITVRKTGYARPTVSVEVSSKRMAHREIELKPARRALLLDELKPKLAAELAAAEGAAEPKGGPAVEDLGKLFRAEVALVTRVEGPPDTKSLELYLFHLETQRLVNVVKIPEIDWSYRNKKAIAAAVDKALTVDWVEVLGGEVADDTDDGGVLEQWWFWTLVGVAAAGGTAAAILLSDDGAAPPPYAKDGTGAIVLQF